MSETLKYLDHSQVHPCAVVGDLPSIIITTPTPDRTRDRAIPERLRMAKKVPVLYGHDYSELPVGLTERSTLEPSKARRAWFDWLKNDERAARVKNAFDQNFLSASIGVNLDWEEPNAYGGRDFGGEIVEFSLCAIPANPECVRYLKAAGLWAHGLPSVCVADKEVTLPAGMTPQDFVRLCRDAVKQIVRRTLARRGMGDLDREVLELDPPTHAQRAHLGHVGPVLRQFKPDEDIIVLDEERGCR